MLTIAAVALLISLDASAQRNPDQIMDDQRTDNVVGIATKDPNYQQRSQDRIREWAASQNSTVDAIRAAQAEERVRYAKWAEAHPEEAKAKAAEAARLAAEASKPYVTCTPFPPEIAARSRSAPQFPPAAFLSGFKGSVEVELQTDACGRVLKVLVLRSSQNRDVDMSVVRGLRGWIMDPIYENGLPVPSRTRTTISFDATTSQQASVEVAR